MIRRKLILFTHLVCILFLSGCGSVIETKNDMKFMFDLKNDQESQLMQINRENVAYERALKAVSLGEIKPGENKGEIGERFGKPAVKRVYSDREEWTYRNNEKHWIGGEKIRFVFDLDGKLTKSECVNVSCNSAE
ncbi:MAG: hypothetical protein A3G33_07670 [Omnitrophica bacterium RIFCSPLOWO2_12_FULL_44_17]|uniref:Lipoprotein SmpA/OmlA domain-containing protein n=1 Tax=Candidatus Danuiimicrobium aquiferis TaxID=1801832 RepID=A0A1G1L1V0_9BACT|nr:MAG: hypothetical protein A3B72_02225 [Omnitrophica bacterium RIFCSPHIGHO2_02_FULL_45_28]OGW92239.1 MAG: hypothetical protein A3E74_09520 [Omnitrophica bacterium RIFCSPHIGHO2_12_FULL_44_12]OGW99106.1 MAG: hypothetical protein A3G33_07670 [Omnitrophica bacterium RIFCSPLOWO2_12_FULL_44_17]OGX02601.1 MAG: hypothetical protein A3J12_01905 [Omnitrophica bacterium RIFCSPLOWO2_02_FULL_44_11]